MISISDTLHDQNSPNSGNGWGFPIPDFYAKQKTGRHIPLMHVSGSQAAVSKPLMTMRALTTILYPSPEAWGSLYA